MKSIEKKIYLGLLVCVLISAVGVSFAYFVSGVSVTGEGADASGKTVDLIKVQYDAGTSALALENAVPGSSTSKGFSIKLTPTDDQKSATYAINLNIASDGNSFVKCTDASKCAVDEEELVYTLKENGVAIAGATGDLLGKTGMIELAKISKTVDVETTFNYTLEVTFKNLETDQNHNANKSLSGSLEVVFAE